MPEGRQISASPQLWVKVSAEPIAAALPSVTPPPLFRFRPFVLIKKPAGFSVATENPDV
jgi:hypothetical protein